MPFIHRLTLIVATLFLLALTIACGSGTGTATTQPAAQPASTAQPTTEGKVGDRIEVNGIALTVIKVDKTDSLNPVQKAKDGNTFVVVEVLLENTGAASSPYNPLYFSVKDSDGYQATPTISGSDTSLKTGELAKGDKARGTVAFEVKQTATGLELTYKPLTLSNVSPMMITLN